MVKRKKGRKGEVIRRKRSRMDEGKTLGDFTKIAGEG